MLKELLKIFMEGGILVQLRVFKVLDLNRISPLPLKINYKVRDPLSNKMGREV